MQSLSQVIKFLHPNSGNRNTGDFGCIYSEMNVIIGSFLCDDSEKIFGSMIPVRAHP